MKKLPIIALGVLTAGAMLAQKTVPAPTAAPSDQSQQQTPAHSQPRQTARNWQDRLLHRLTMRLNLSADQQMQVKGILQQARAENKSLQPQVRQERMQLHAAIKSDSLGQIDQITHQNMDLNSKMEATHVKTIAKIYSILTPDQKAKFDQRFDRATGAHQAKGA
jgi:Spy/CpxP family protein refolding chaperone